MEDLIKDFTVVVGHRKLRTNRNCLEKHSDYFKAMFSSGMRESRTSSVKLQNVDEDLMCQIIEFCERGVRIRVSENNVLRFLAAGTMLQMEALKESAEQFLVERLSAANVSDTFKAADFYGSSNLRDACAKFLCWSLEDSVEQLTTESLELVQHILRSEYSHWNEDLMFKAVMAVIRGRSVEKAQQLLDCIFAHNVTSHSDVFSLYRNVGSALQGSRKESSTLAVVLENQEAFLFDRRSSKFVKFAKLPTKLEGYGLVSHGQYCYVIGGEARIGYGKWNKAVYRYDFLKNSWEHFADMQDCCRSFVTFATVNSIFLIGGYGKFRMSLKNQLAVLDLSSRRWNIGKFKNAQLSSEYDNLTNVLYRDNHFYLFDSNIRKVREEDIGRSSGQPIVIENFPVEPVRCALPFLHDLIVITIQNNVYYCNLTTKIAKKLDVNSSATYRPDLRVCHLVDDTLFNVKSHKITEYRIDIEASTLTKVKTYQMIDETGNGKICASCKVPYF